MPRHSGEEICQAAALGLDLSYLDTLCSLIVFSGALSYGTDPKHTLNLSAVLEFDLNLNRYNI